MPVGGIEHATGPTDVVLRFDSSPDFGICELCGGWGTFTPGPEFTLYGDGTVIVRNDRAEQPPAEGRIIRANAFMITQLDESGIQTLLRFALGEGGLRDARQRYEAADTDPAGSSIFAVRAGGLNKRVEVVGGDGPLLALAEHLRTFDAGADVPMRAWVPDRYWGLLIEVSSLIDVGVLSAVSDADVAAWPWPGLAPAYFARRPTDTIPQDPRRALSSAEAAVLGLSDNGGVVQRIYLRGPDNKTIYSFSLWPMLPDETSALPPDATPTQPPAPLMTPGPLVVDGLARVVASRLRVRSAPDVSSSSDGLGLLLESGTLLIVIAGPVTGSGYDWYMVTPVEDRADEFRYRVDVVPIGWVASAARDGTPWLAGTRADCPDPGAFFEDLSVLERLGPLTALTCFGDRDLSFRATSANSHFMDTYGPETYSPDWLMFSDQFRFWTSPSYSTDTTVREPFETALDPVRFPNGSPDLGTNLDWDVIGHFDDRAAATCRIDDPENTRALPVNASAVVLMCRTTFVVTGLHRFEGIDPG